MEVEGEEDKAERENTKGGKVSARQKQKDTTTDPNGKGLVDYRAKGENCGQWLRRRRGKKEKEKREKRREKEERVRGIIVRLSVPTLCVCEYTSIV